MKRCSYSIKIQSCHPIAHNHKLCHTKSWYQASRWFAHTHCVVFLLRASTRALKWAQNPWEQPTAGRFEHLEKIYCPCGAAEEKQPVSLQRDSACANFEFGRRGQPFQALRAQGLCVFIYVQYKNQWGKTVAKLAHLASPPAVGGSSSNNKRTRRGSKVVGDCFQMLPFCLWWYIRSNLVYIHKLETPTIIQLGIMKCVVSAKLTQKMISYEQCQSSNII